MYLMMPYAAVFLLIGLVMTSRLPSAKPLPEPDIKLHIPSNILTNRWELIVLFIVLVMVDRLLGAKPLPEPMLTYFQLDQ